MEESITLKKIADLTGFSASTISKALNNKCDVSIKTKETIIEIAKSLNYTPNYLAVSLRRKKSYTIAVVACDISSHQCAKIISEAQKLSFKNGFKLQVFQHFENKDLENEIISFLNEGSADGVILIDSDFNNNYSLNPISIPNFVMKSTNSNALNDNFNKFLKKIL